MTIRGGMGMLARSVCALAVAGGMALASAATSSASTPGLPTAYVTNSQLATVSVYVGAHFAGTVHRVGSGPTGIAIDQATATAYVVDYGFFNQPSHTVTPVDLSTRTAGPPITVGTGPLAIALTPDDRFAVVTLQGTAAHPGHWVREINLATRAVSPAIDVGLNPESLAITPDGHTAYVAAFGSGEVTPVDLTAWPPRALPPIMLPGTSPRAIAIAPNGRRAYVLDTTNATVIPIAIPNGTVGAPFDLNCRMGGDPGCTPSAIVISPDSRTAYVSAAGSADVILLSLPSLAVAGVLQAGAYPDAVALSGRWLYVANGASDTMSIFPGLQAPRTAGGVTYPFGIAVVPPAGGATGSGPVAGLLPVTRTGAGGAPTVRTPPAPFYGEPAA